ncbi:MAG: hypothetical protein O7C72_07660 [Deltaproteobacteria bacterium]|nr:hypothetical protein [Deltaproteobacteria bacterium]
MNSYVGKGATAVRQVIDSDGHLWEDAETKSKYMSSPCREIREIEEHKELTEEDKKAILYKNAKRFYRI